MLMENNHGLSGSYIGTYQWEIFVSTDAQHGIHALLVFPICISIICLSQVLTFIHQLKNSEIVHMVSVLHQQLIKLCLMISTRTYNVSHS